MTNQSENYLLESNITIPYVLEEAKANLSQKSYDRFVEKLFEESLDKSEYDVDFSDDEIKRIISGIDLKADELEDLDSDAFDFEWETYWSDVDFSDASDIEVDDVEELIDQLDDEEDEEDLDESLMEKLSKLGRLKLSRSMKKNSKKLGRKRTISMKKHASREVLMKRAVIAAKNAVRARFLRGRSYSELSASEKEQIEARMSKMKPVIQRVANRMLKVVKKRELARLNNKTTPKE